MPFDDIGDFLEDLFDEIEDVLEDFVDILLGKQSKKKHSKKFERHGGIAGIASVAAFAFQNWEKEETVAKTPEQPKKPEFSQEEIETIEIVTVTECLRVNMVLAMISAASADGKIDRRELALLETAIDDSQITEKDKAMLTRILNQPPTLEEVASSATSPLDACELYGAALSVIEENSPAETLFLRRFANALKLDEDLVAAIEQAIR